MLNGLKSAFLAPANLIGLTAAFVGAMFMGDATPALVALGLEGVYLGTFSPFLARTKPPARSTESDASADALVSELAPSQKDHYRALLQLRDRILTNYRKLPAGGIVAASSESRIDALLTSFLRLLSTLNQYRTYLNGADRQQVEGELASLRKELEDDGPGRVRDVKLKRVDILERRLQRFTQASENREIVSHQLAGIEDMLRLTHEQSIAIRDPEMVNRQLDVLSAEVDATDETVRELEKFMEFSDELRPPVSHGTRTR